MAIDHLSFSQWKAWAECPASAYAQYVAGTWEPRATRDMVLGRLVHEAVYRPQSQLADMIRELPEADRALVVTSKGLPVAAAEDAWAWGRIVRAKLALDNAAFEVPLAIEIGGIRWEAHADIIERSSRMVWDIKTCPDPQGTEWDGLRRARVSWIAARRIGYQLAIYRAACAREFGGEWGAGIIAVGKRHLADGLAWPDLLLYMWSDDERLDAYVDALAACCQAPWTCELGTAVPPIPAMYEMDAAAGAKLPRCEACDWCVFTRTGENLVRPYADPT